MDDFSLLQQLARRELINLLEDIPGTKNLIVEKCLMRPLDKLVTLSFLAQHGCPRKYLSRVMDLFLVDFPGVQQLHMDKNILWDPNLDKRVFICRPSLSVIQKIAELIKADPIQVYCVVLVDRLQNFCEIELERHGVHGFVTFYELKLYATSLESDLFSLELPQPTCKVSHDQLGIMCKLVLSPSHVCLCLARTLWLIQSLYGLIPVTYGIGEQSRQLEIHLNQLFNDEAEPSSTADRPISHLFVFDRQLDLASVFMTAMTYESMLNDCFEYSCGKIIFGEMVENKLKSQSNKNKSRIFALNNSDEIFSAVRDKHMKLVLPFLSER